jgi:hypothetical protein
MRDQGERHASVREIPSATHLAMIVLGIGLAFSLTGLLRPQLVGDGAEYYAMFFAWKDTLRPFMTEASWTAINTLSTSGEIANFIPVERLRDDFPALRAGDTSDFNHFWLYSALAALVSAAASVVHVGLSAHTAFIVTHWLLFSLAAVLAYWYFQFKGLAAVLALSILSPMVWYVDKVHTEFFTFCLTLSAVIAFSARNYILSALFLAIASTQNISFAAVAAVPFANHFLDSRNKRRSRSSPASILYAILACLFILLHPVYYLSRYGVITPQFLSGGADVGGNLSLFYIWLVDPDVGLLPNWPLGFAVLCLGAFIWRPRRMSRETFLFLCFLAAYLSISLVAQSSTENLNSGASPGLARYATWYIALFFPLLLFIFAATKDSLWSGIVLFLACLGSLLHTLRFNNPQTDQVYLTPSPVSLYLQKNAPALYDPPAEVFAERYGGMGEMPALSRALAIVGPDCRKILAFPGPNRDRVYGAECPFSEEKVRELLAHRLDATPPPGSPTYISLSDHEAARAIVACPPKMDFTTGEGVPSTALKGFSTPELHGRWTDGDEASITCSVASDGNGTPARMRIATMAFVHGGHSQRVSVSLNGGQPKVLEYVPGDAAKVLEFDLSATRSPAIRLHFALPDAVSPQKLGVNSDARRIAISVRTVEFE